MAKKKKISKPLAIILIILILVIGTYFMIMSFNQIPDKQPSSTFQQQEELEGMNDTEMEYLVDPAKILSGGPPKGGIGFDRGIPALAENNIKFVTVEEANEWIADNELVLAIDYKGEKRVYPLQILVWHEIVNDHFGDEAVLITYCPLCGTGIAYESYITVDGEKTESRFGTSGKLYNSNLVMYDEETDTYWQQIDGKAIVGDLVGQELRELSVDTVVWGDYKQVHTEAKVLSQDTGMIRNYGRDPYGSYYEDSFLFFSVEEEDDRVHPKTVIHGIEIDGKYKAYKEDDLKVNPSIEDNFAGANLLIERDEAGIITITNTDNGKEVVKERGFWFSWYAFHPETQLYESD